MSTQSRNRAILGVLAATLLAAAVGVMAYNAGVAHGLAESGRLAAAPGGPGSYIYVWPRPWGFGFGFFPLLVLFLGFFLVRRLLWGGRGWGWGHYYDGVPPRFEEWHRRLHQQDAPPKTPTGA